MCTEISTGSCVGFVWGQCTEGSGVRGPPAAPGWGVTAASPEPALMLSSLVAHVSVPGACRGDFYDAGGGEGCEVSRRNR